MSPAVAGGLAGGRDELRELPSSAPSRRRPSCARPAVEWRAQLSARERLAPGSPLRGVGPDEERRYATLAFRERRRSPRQRAILESAAHRPQGRLGARTGLSSAWTLPMQAYMLRRAFGTIRQRLHREATAQVMVHVGDQTHRMTRECPRTPAARGYKYWGPAQPGPPTNRVRVGLRPKRRRRRRCCGQRPCRS